MSKLESNVSGKFVIISTLFFLIPLAGVLHLMFGSIGAYLSWLAVWWPIIAVATLPHTMLQVSTMGYRWHLNHLDRKYPDVLDEHAGYWLKARVAAAGLANEVEVGKTKEADLSGLDAYLPLRDKILLGDETYDKQDPTYWAIAAHELGHAIDFRARPLLRPLSLISRVTSKQFVFWANAVLFGNILFGWALASDVWWFLLVGALVTGAVVLVDEALASRIGLKILSEEHRITPPMMKDLRRHLLVAFGTYFSGTFAVLLVLLGSEWIADYVETHAVFVPAEPLYPGRTTLANGLSLAVLMVMLAAERTRIARWGRRLRGKDQPDLGGRVSNTSIKSGCLTFVIGFVVTAGFFVEVWDQPLGLWYRAAVFMYVPIVLKLAIPATAPVTLFMNLPVLIAQTFIPKGPAETPVSRAKAAAKDVVTYVKAVDPRQRIPWYTDASPGMLHFTLPLLIVWWASQIPWLHLP